MVRREEDIEVVDALALGTEDSPVEITESGLTLNLGEPAQVDEEGTVREVTAQDLAALAALEAQWAARPQDDAPNPSLDRVQALLDLLGHPEQVFDVIHIAGTNGKTSTARMADSLLRAFHRRVGLFTSPKLTSVTDCIVIDGQNIHPADVVAAWEDIAPYVAMVDQQYAGQGQAPLSTFELQVALAFACFADAPVDVAVVEVGMGGTWDATNVVNADVAVITPVSLEHQSWLGQTLGEVAAHKAGIIKPRVVAADDFAGPAENLAILAPQEPEAQRVLLEAAVSADAMVARAGSEFHVVERAVAVGGQVLTLRGLGGVYDQVFLPLSGAHQALNASVALAAVEGFFGARADRGLDVELVRHGFAQVSVPGRMERVRTDPVTFVDSAHNPHGAASLAATLREDFHFQGVVGIVSILRDKDAAEILTCLEPVFEQLIVSQSSSPRAVPAQELAELAYDIFGDERVLVTHSLIEAMDTAISVIVEEVEEDGWGIVATGSITTAAEIRAMSQQGS
ncbi:bifunctional folylpolyglutamate synthase/dihydrofolate synthase [Corynebacterium lizhenjunii]|uniref:bifunctional folylpolyglutamate synthase/dihydrofolate synthase n=1 Tax=Corynebacterium lizhenjunii TaxID=2709394 RepID=UPI0013ED9BAA|nr:folylpolyglutamate synthase/dihydrofolate synthase family protein [Corynebacterium lizhenjunii]